MLRRKIDRPMVTIIIATRPVPRFRSGAQRPQSCTYPKTPETRNATMMATITVMLTPPMEIVPGMRSMPRATRAPKVMSSPCAKLVRPVVPKISDRPNAAIASSSENVIPPTRS